MMAEPSMLLGNEDYIEAITKEKDGSLTKYTLRTNDTFAKFAKEDVHRPEENFILIENRDIYWIDKDGLLVKHQNYNEFELTIDGIPDTYIADTTTELTSYNYRNLNEFGDEKDNIEDFINKLEEK